MAESKFSSLYKDNSRNESIDRKQSERREELLAEQKLQRSNLQDKSRNLDDFLEKLQLNEAQSEHLFKNYVQLSEWLSERPNDLENWYFVPCPRGQRCIIVATKGSTKMFSKRGVFQKKFRSLLPGDFTSKSSVTILDCFCVDHNDSKIYMVLDAVCYRNLDLLNCDVSFRFFWVAAKLSELKMEEVNAYNDFAFEAMKFVDCADECAIDDCLSSHPMWQHDDISLDGIMFYHKESSYVHGTTPLVGWLFPFMLKEVLGYNLINPNYLTRRPHNYVNAKLYIEQFDSMLQLEKRRKKRYKDIDGKMDEDFSEEQESMDSWVEEQSELEMNM